MFDSYTAYVAAIDGVPVAAGREGWNAPVTLTPGRHRLTVAFARGAFAARADLVLEARSAAAYRLQFATDAHLFGGNSYCDFWIVDAGSGVEAAPKVRAALSRPAKPN